MGKRLVVIGNGIAGIATVDEVLRLDPDMQISIFGKERHFGYNRVLLSEVLAGKMGIDSIYLKNRDWYEKNNIDLHLGMKVVGIDTQNKKITAEDGSAISYDSLLVATGSSSYIPPIKGVEKEGVFPFRNIEDTEGILNGARDSIYEGKIVASVVYDPEGIMEKVRMSKKAIVIGGGLLGLEAARALSLHGVEVTIAHIMDRLMEQYLDETASHMLKKELERMGIRVLLNHEAAQILGYPRVRGVSFSDGGIYDADLVVIAAGIRPNIEFARRSGIKVNKGILVNDHMETSVKDIYSVGECAEHRDRTYGLVAPIMEQAKVAAGAICGSGGASYEGSIPASILKVMGISLMSIGDFSDQSADIEEIVYKDESASVYKKVLVRKDRVTGAILLGDVNDGPRILRLVKEGIDVSSMRTRILFGDQASGTATMSEADLVCRCLGITKGMIVKAIEEHGITSLNGVAKHTKACTSCRGCSSLIEQILQEALGGDYSVEPKDPPLCSCINLSQVELRDKIIEKGLKSVKDVLINFATAPGCEKCKPAISYLLNEVWIDGYEEDRSARFINDRVHANIQKDGGFSVIPRIPGGVVTSEELRKIADVADRYAVPMVKITGGQRISLFGVKKEQLPAIWSDLGMRSGHAYTKAVRTCKTCVGTQFCRFGLADSISLGVAMESRFQGLATPAKIKIGVSGCPRNCAEATIKDIGVVGIQDGWEVYVGGNGGNRVRSADLLVSVKSGDDAIRVSGLFLQYYREDGRFGERTSSFVERVGMEKIKETLFKDSLKNVRLGERLDLSLAVLKDPWEEGSKPVAVRQFEELGVYEG
ncbi:MAG: NAD(P)/FAD-dependent oxidoreductase [Nitrospirae bacterium]|nr:NAD(P)/FAD-dependent oxidoreductase [Nitrospirota bacterium]